MFHLSSFDANSLGMNTVLFARSVLGTSAGFFSWLSPSGHILKPELYGLEPTGWNEYAADYACHDPLNIGTSISQKRRLVLYSNERDSSRADVRAYERFRSRHAIADELSFIFWTDGVPFAALAAIKTVSDRPFSANMVDWAAMRDYFEFTLSAHPRVRKARLLRMLELRFNITPREIEVIELLCNGASNAAIATVLDIKLATVKTHVLNIFEKLGVESRAAVAAYCQAP
jgi:DNA-binding CsgD family transcriptional regulator